MVWMTFNLGLPFKSILKVWIHFTESYFNCLRQRVLNDLQISKWTIFASLKCSIVELDLQLLSFEKQKYPLCYVQIALAIKPDRNCTLSQKIFSHFCLIRTAPYCKNLFLALVSHVVTSWKILLLCNIFSKALSPSQAVFQGAKTTNLFGSFS